jgi:hypothetical protein
MKNRDKCKGQFAFTQYHLPGGCFDLVNGNGSNSANRRVIREVDVWIKINK